MWYFELNLRKVEVYIQKSIQRVLKKQIFWSFKKLKFEYLKQKYTYYIEKKMQKMC